MKINFRFSAAVRLTGLAAALSLGYFFLGHDSSVATLRAQNVSPNGRSSPYDDSGPLFQTSDRCIACHNGLVTTAGEDVSFGYNWRPTMMANAGRDPYWMAGVRREITDHPMAQKLIEDECSVCHLPMARTSHKAMGQEGQIFSHIPTNRKKKLDRLAQDGVSCSVCHQIQPDKFGTRESFNGGYVIDLKTPFEKRKVFGPYEIDQAHTTIMNSSSTFVPTQGKHIQQSELCATCHTLYTQALDAQGKVIGELPEQMPYQEWLHSDYKETKSCQACHMPMVEEKVAITGVLGEPRADVRRHTFLGGNFFMQGILNKFRNEMQPIATPQEFDNAIKRTMEHLATQTAKVSISNIAQSGGRLQAEIAVENLGGHKLPTAYPSRRAWLHVTVKDRDGKLVFESGKMNPNGSIVGNDNDEDATKFEPHYSEITAPDQVQVYESVMGDQAGKPTTGLLTGFAYIKDNRLLPHGFDKRTANKDVQVVGPASTDNDFTAGGDRIRYSVNVGNAQGPFQIEAELLFQPIGYRWAHNLDSYNNAEAKRFASFYNEMSSVSAAPLAKASATR